MTLPSGARPCPVCGAPAESGRVFAESTIDPSKLGAFAFASRKVPEYMHPRLIECPTCDALYASPAPDAGTLARAYEAAAFDSGAEAACAARTYGRLLRRLLARRRLPDRGGALDIGTGDGAFLGELLDARFTRICGVEPSTAPVEAAAPRVRPLIRQGMFRAGDFEPNRYSLVTCFQTIEHLDDPLGICRDALGLLKPGGAMLLVAHNRRALSAKLLGRKSPIFDVEHLQLFSKRAARELMTWAGFVDVAVTSIVNRYPLHYWMRLFPLPGTLKGRAIGLSKSLRVGFVPVPLPAGNMAVVGFKPRP